MATRLLVTAAQRRSRMQRRHLLTECARTDDVSDVVRAVVALHATCAPTVFMSVWARTTTFVPADLEAQLYRSRSLVRQLAMRRTMFVVDRDTLADAVSAVGARVAASERTAMLRDLRRGGDFGDPEGWIDKARSAVLDALADGTLASSADLRGRLPELDGVIDSGPHGTRGAPSPLGPRVLNMMSAAGEIVRGTNTARWHVSRPRWSSMSRWLGDDLRLTDPESGHRAMVERWLRSFGPGTVTDIVWWLGSTKSAVRRALVELDAVEVDVEVDAGRIEVGYLLPDDLDPDDAVAPHGFMLPELDPTTMGWKERGWYLGPHGAQMFDSNGNGGQTIWWEGRIVGGWFLRPDGSIGLHPLEELPGAARKALTARAAVLAEWLGEVRPKPGYPAPFMTETTP